MKKQFNYAELLTLILCLQNEIRELKENTAYVKKYFAFDNLQQRLNAIKVTERLLNRVYDEFRNLV